MTMTVCEPIEWNNFSAYRLANQHLEAVVVPALARVMSFKRPGGMNWMWADPTCIETYANGSSSEHWMNWGGDNTWLSPQSRWSELAGNAWPPDPAWGDPLLAPHVAELMIDGRLLVKGPISTVTGLRLSRIYQLDGSEWITTQIVENVTGEAHTCGLWSITDIARPDAAYFVPFADSGYPNQYRLFDGLDDSATPDLSLCENLLILRSTTNHQYKFGLDSPVAALAARFGREILVQRAERPAGEYPDGEFVSAGLPVEYFDSGTLSTQHPFAELELLGPLVTLKRGESTRHLMRWHLETLDADPESPAALAQIDAALRRPLP
jgi:Domain of unknown function (DUF4380)